MKVNPNFNKILAEAIARQNGVERNTHTIEWHTENPPDIEKWYLVTLKKGKDRIVSMKIWTHDFEKWGWVTDADRVLAWTELPEVYEGD